MADNPYSSLDRSAVDLPGNSDKQQDVKAVARGERKPSTKKRLMKAFLADDVTDIKEFFIYEILIPEAKKLIDSTIHSILFGQTKRDDRYGSYRDYASYSDYYTRSRDYRRPEPVRKKQAQKFDNEFWFRTEQDAREVLRSMNTIIESAGVCSVADLCRLSHISSDWTDNDYGWFDVRGVKIARYRGGYILDLPTAHLLD